MSGKLVDTNILIYLSKKRLEFDKIAAPSDTLFISVVTYMEVLGYSFSSIYEKQLIETLCQHFPVIDLNREIVEKVIQIRQKHKIKLPDAIILASAMVNNLELITANVADFNHVAPDLKITNPLV